MWATRDICSPPLLQKKQNSNGRHAHCAVIHRGSEKKDTSSYCPPLQIHSFPCELEAGRLPLRCNAGLCANRLCCVTQFRETEARNRGSGWIILNSQEEFIESLGPNIIVCMVVDRWCTSDAAFNFLSNSPTDEDEM